MVSNLKRKKNFLIKKDDKDYTLGSTVFDDTFYLSRESCRAGRHVVSFARDAKFFGASGTEDTVEDETVISFKKCNLNLGLRRAIMLRNIKGRTQLESDVDELRSSRSSVRKKKERPDPSLQELRRDTRTSQ